MNAASDPGRAADRILRQKTRGLRWALGIGAAAMVAVGLVLLFLLTQATNNRELYERNYARLFIVNVVVATLLHQFVGQAHRVGHAGVDEDDLAARREAERALTEAEAHAAHSDDLRFARRALLRAMPSERFVFHPQGFIAPDGKHINLSPGMNVTAEIKTGKRRVIEYLLSPIQRSVSESLGER